MSASPQQEAVADNKFDDLDEREQPTADETEGAGEVSDAAPVKRGRGRPKGSRNKKSGGSTAPGASSEAGVKRKRGRPPKERKANESGEEEPVTKRKRGRPPKTSKTETAAGAESGGEW
ncbi:hypothetical protein SERLA73DRAFT_186384 [Serpula lacrymans var. lacrymans S7.3]|uniref:Uncharacterized protein n=1 Tax=Serpula lacrymans var. lacrymans (strain S7.3) TaxID=936435 RepID=F8Q771_SERL3|nr:hypothetical protein SERLA73DRAFT_186384 [Serpula lacrymans var. lacrymans S7.3]